ncbi:MAG: alpha/beta hydrolase, partial [Halieaceae bacterium]|nr:alpha/beta hydrolase [Halieaceae bacterium]
FVKTRDLAIHYQKQGSGAPVILLHGWPQTAYEWRHQIDHLARSFTVYAPDNRGFGLTDKPRIRITRDLLARDVIEFMDALGLAQATLIGHDWGGIIGFKVAMDYADRVDRIGLIDTSTTHWPSWAGHAYWAKVPDVAMAFFSRCSDDFMGWCFAGERPDYGSVVAPFPPDPLPGALYDWCDSKALSHYRSAFSPPDVHFASTQYYSSGLPMHRVQLTAQGEETFDYIGGAGCVRIWNHPQGFVAHPDVAEPLCFGPEDWNKTFDKPALFVYSPMLVPAGFKEGEPVAGYQLGGNSWEDSIVRPFPQLQTRAISCGHYIPEEAPDALNAVLDEFLL